MTEIVALQGLEVPEEVSEVMHMAGPPDLGPAVVVDVFEGWGHKPCRMAVGRATAAQRRNIVADSRQSFGVEERVQSLTERDQHRQRND